ncbi:uncharacterized protein (TIGR02246 family) [Nocardia tenerifensis]|uniref:Uncharacterized protein (TIGR02246 family) n=1 Tax=Nocardia tenerifensis TaxID=228006 RepID=A0A318K3Z5_9NOCA|nr:SgcJ/EcaC family oxidoreductase [Nocardia tenerifensis]PXX63214.1 uncharacterized protein (TIGR02246 family) [Nocardia tenerifensis]
MNSNHTADQRRDIEAVLTELAQAWGRGDADAYGALFTEDASYTAWFGSVYQGRADIVASHRALFDSFLKGTKMADALLDIRFYGPDTAVVNSSGDIYKANRKRPEKLSKVQTYTLVRLDGRWLIAAFQNTKCKKLMQRFTFRFAPDARPAAAR